jgi:hypothetical protein
MIYLHIKELKTPITEDCKAQSLSEEAKRVDGSLISQPRGFPFEPRYLLCHSAEIIMLFT